MRVSSARHHAIVITTSSLFIHIGGKSEIQQARSL